MLNQVSLALTTGPSTTLICAGQSTVPTPTTVEAPLAAGRGMNASRTVQPGEQLAAAAVRKTPRRRQAAYPLTPIWFYAHHVARYVDREEDREGGHHKRVADAFQATELGEEHEGWHEGS